MKAFFSGLARLRRGPLEAVASFLIGLGVFLLMQLFTLFILFVTLTGTMFIIVSHFPE